ncbi:hypothetical protein B0H11DRAFT_1363248 [Mycena galericulata]|nr:hypothetical protein B0H11DRAFT_1363248 [Mycena galericulata]
MADDLHTDQSHPVESVSTVSEVSGDSTRYDGAFFPGAQHFVVNGGHFTSNIFNSPPDVPSDFRRIPLGDVDLRHEIRMDASGVVHWQGARACARKMYSARVEGKQSDMTVAVYQGENAEEKWKLELAKYSGIRHPNFVQPFGIVSASGLYATIFHDELVPVGQYLEEYRHSIISFVYLHAYVGGELQDAIHYLEPLVGIRALAIIYSESTAWIRRSAGRLCVELSNTSGINFADYPWTQPPLIPISVRRGEHESAIISTLTLEQYHQTCFTYFKKRSSAREDTRNHNIRLGAVHCSGGDGDGDQEIAHVRNFLAPDSKLVWERRTGNRSLVVIDNGWTRFTLPCDEKIGIDSSLRLSTPYDWDKLAQRWLSQANYIFRQYPITAPYEDYALVSHIKYRLKLLAPSEIHPEGYLFLCPPEDLKSEDVGFIERPECPAYWSLDPSGSERLSPEEAFAHGFPSFEWQRTVDFWSWDEWVYAGLSQFHAGKGFDPYSQDIAQHLGYPLYQLSRVPAPVGAHIEEISPEPDVGTPATITDVNPLEHDDDCLIAEQNHQQTDPTVSGIAGQKTEQIDQRLAARNFRLITVGALGIVLALLLAYLCSL